MKCFFMFILIFITYSAHAQENIVFNFNILTFGGGVDIPVIKKHPMEGYIAILGIEIESRNMGIGFSPCMAFIGL